MSERSQKRTKPDGGGEGSGSEQLSTVERLHLNARSKEGWDSHNPILDIWKYISKNDSVEQDFIEDEWGRRGLKAVRKLMEIGYVSYTLDWKLQAEVRYQDTATSHKGGIPEVRR